jgi:hypothetical protein
MAFSEYGLSQLAANGLAGLTIGGMTLPFIVWLGLILIIGNLARKLHPMRSQTGLPV